MDAEQNQHVTVRRLPDGIIFAALLDVSSHRILRLSFPGQNDAPELRAGDLVEVSCTATLYLGEVRTRLGQALTVDVEHALDRAALESIQQVWYVPAED